MPRQFIPIIAVANPTAAAFETAVNAALAPLVSSVIWAFDPYLTDKAPATTRSFRLIIEHEPIGIIISSPFKVRVFEGYDDPSAAGMAAAFIALNPNWFYAPIIYRYTDQMSGQDLRSLIVLPYCEDGSAAPNWLPASGLVSTTTVTSSTTSTSSTTTQSTTTTTTSSTTTTTTTTSSTTTTTAAPLFAILCEDGDELGLESVGYLLLESAP